MVVLTGYIAIRLVDKVTMAPFRFSLVGFWLTLIKLLLGRAKVEKQY